MAIHIVLASHGLFAREALNTVGMIIGDHACQVDVLSVTVEKTYEMCLEELQALYEGYVKVSEDGQPEVLILTDIYGGTPSNISTYLSLSKPNIQVYSGFNLPLLMELFIACPETLAQACGVLEYAYTVSMVNVTEKLKEVEEYGDQMDSY